ncbi:unnamed protein product [Sphagnum jensenii]
MCSRAMSLLLSSDQVPSHVSLNHLMRRNLDRIISWQSWIISFFTARMLQALSSPKNEGLPTGVFVDTAMSLVTCFVPEPSLEERRAALIAASKLASARGLTSVVDFGRFSPGETAQQAWDDLNEEIPVSHQLHVGGVKTFADGSLGSGSDLFHDIEHAQHLSGGAPGHFGASGVIASVQLQTSAGLMSTPFIAAIY